MDVPMTFTIPMYVIYAGAGTTVTFIVSLFLIKKIKSKIVLSKQKRKKQKEKEERDEELRYICERDELIQLLPQPWLDLYDKCLSQTGTTARMLLVDAWIEQIESLPQLSWEAVNKLANVAEASYYYPDEFVRIMDKLKPYLMFKTHEKEPRELPDLFGKLPVQWNDLYEELKEYPAAARCLFFKRIDFVGSDKSKQHPCCKIPLSVKQAALFARSIAKNESEEGFYASDLAKFIRRVPAKQETLTPPELLAILDRAKKEYFDAEYYNEYYTNYEYYNEKY